MASVNRGSVAGAFLAVALTAVLVYFGTGLFPRWPLLWFAPLPILLFAQRNSWWASGLCAFFGWSLGALNNQHYFGSLLHLPRSVQAEIIAGPAVLLAISVLLFRALVRRGASWSALLAFPAVYTSCEFLVDLGSPHGTAGSLSYSQLNFLPFLQLASITGPSGMMFFILLFSSGVAVAIHLWKTAFKRAILILAASWGSLALVLIFGAVRLAISPQGPAVKVGLIASDLR